MLLNNHSPRTMENIFDQYSSGDVCGFTKTVVPVELARHGQDMLIARSQAKRLLARVELFRTVLFDFSEVEMIGPAFADEIFRVFARRHPEIELRPIRANSSIQGMVARASQGNRAPGKGDGEKPDTAS